jgi:hypothetical protein
VGFIHPGIRPSLILYFHTLFLLGVISKKTPVGKPTGVWVKQISFQED